VVEKGRRGLKGRRRSGGNKAFEVESIGARNNEEHYGTKRKQPETVSGVCNTGGRRFGILFFTSLDQFKLTNYLYSQS